MFPLDGRLDVMCRIQTPDHVCVPETVTDPPMPPENARVPRGMPISGEVLACPKNINRLITEPTQVGPQSHWVRNWSHRQTGQRYHLFNGAISLQI